MQKRGLIDKTRCPTDQRGWNVTLTDEGRAAVTKAAPAHVGAVRRHFIDLLTPDQIETLDAVARVILDHLPDGPTTASCE